MANSTSFSSTNQPKRRRGKTKTISELVNAIGRTEPGKKIGDAMEKILGTRPKSFDEAHVMSLYKSACIDGNIKASELLLKIQRQYPRDEVDVTTGGKPIDNKFKIEIIRHREQLQSGQDDEDTDDSSL